MNKIITKKEETYQQDTLIDTQISTAKAYPRNIQQAVKDIIEIATLDKETAMTCSYSLPRGGKTVAGPTVHLAKIIAQNWGNIRAEAKVIRIEDKHVVSQAIAFDLEKNVAIKVEVKRSIMTRSGRMNDDMITVTGNAANSISLRNAIFSVVPSQITNKVYKKTQEFLVGDLQTRGKVLKKAKELFENLKASLGVTDSEILRVVGKTEISQITASNIVTLLGVVQAIADGDTTIDLAFGRQKEKKQDNRSELLKYIEDEVGTIEALEDVKNSLKTEQEKEAWEKKFADLQPKTSDGSLIEDKVPYTDV